MSDILLVNPTAMERKPASLSAPPHLGLAMVAAVAEDSGYSVSMLDFGFAGYNENRLRRVLQKENPKIVGVSVVSPALREVLAAAGVVRDALPDAALVLGGPHVSVDSTIVRELSADYGFAGESERGFAMLCNNVLKDEGDLDKVPGLVYRKNSVWKGNKPDYTTDLDSLPNPALHLHSFGRNEGVPVMASRGCPFSCTYCTQARSMKVRFRSPQRIVDEIEGLAREHPTNFFSFIDDVFTLDRERTLEICRLLGENVPNVRWSAITRADCVDEELLSAMKKAGCFHLSFGVESGVEEIRYRLGKRIPNGDYARAFGWCNRLGIRSCAYAMYGLPGESWEDMEATTRFVKRLRPTYGFFKTTVLMPGSMLFEQAAGEGKVHKSVWRDFMHGRCGIPHYVPDNLSLSDVEFARRAAVKSFYLSGRFAGDHVKLGCGFFETLNLMKLAYEEPDVFS